MKYDEKILQLVANTIRGLSIDAIELANSGHPGLPLGCAEIMAYLYGYELNYNLDKKQFRVIILMAFLMLFFVIYADTLISFINLIYV